MRAFRSMEKATACPARIMSRIISGKLLAGPAPSMLAAARKRSAAQLRLKGSQASAVDALSVSRKLTAKLIADQKVRRTPSSWTETRTQLCRAARHPGAWLFCDE